MAEISTPLIITGFLQGIWEDPSIHSIYTYRHESMSGKEELTFAVFFSPANDMDNPYFHDVKKLYEDGAITPQGRAFVVSDWRLVAVTKIDGDSPISIFQNSRGDNIRWDNSPIGLDNEKVPEQDWPIYSEKDYREIVQRIEGGDLGAYKALVGQTPPVSGYILLEAPSETSIAEDRLQQIAQQVLTKTGLVLKTAGDDAFDSLAIKPMGLVLSPPSLTIQFQAPSAGIAKIVDDTYRRSWNEALLGVPGISAGAAENFMHLIYAEAK